MRKFRKKPVVIMAKQWEELLVKNEKFHLNVVPWDKPSDVTRDLCDLCGESFHHHGRIKTLEGHHIVCPNDWIIKGIKGEYYPCKPDIFEATYEEIEEE